LRVNVAALPKLSVTVAIGTQFGFAADQIIAVERGPK
jgi:hypothetical protein